VGEPEGLPSGDTDAGVWWSASRGVDGRPLIEAEGVEPGHPDVWMEDIVKLVQSIPVWRRRKSPVMAWVNDRPLRPGQ
jgi:hypothetical protein